MPDASIVRPFAKTLASIVKERVIANSPSVRRTVPPSRDEAKSIVSPDAANAIASRTRKSVLSILQMPGGVPVATFGAGAGGPVNAALFVARVLALSDPALAARVAAYRESQAEKVAAKDARLQEKLGNG